MGLCTVCTDADNMSAAGRDGCECTTGTLTDGTCVSSDDSDSSGDGANILKVAMFALSCLFALLL